MCSGFDPLSCLLVKAASGLIGGSGPGDVATDVVTGLVTKNFAAILGWITAQLHEGIQAIALVLAGWILVPATKVCLTTDADWIATCATGTSPAVQLRGWLLPITALVAIVGIVWQGITMAVTRRGEPLLTVLKGLFSTALWGAVGIAGTQLVLRAGDAYAFWILKQAIFGDATDPTASLGSAIAGMSAADSIASAPVLLLLLPGFLFVTVAQIILMIFREGAVVILAGQLQLAAAGGFTRLTSGWLAKLTGWMLALIAYKPIAATIYAVAFALLGDGVRNLLMGLVVMLMAVIAMPALMRFFNWSVGAIATHGNGLGMIGTSLAAGLHGAAAVNGLGGYGATDHARWLDSHGPGTSGPADGGGPSGAGSAPTGPSTPPPTNPSGGATSAGGTGTSTSASATGAAAAGAGAATGGVATVIIAAADQARQQVHRGANAAGDAMQGK
jgi:hypothetical protein